MIIVTSLNQTCHQWLFPRNGLTTFQASLPQPPAERRQRYIEDWGIPAYDAGVLTQTKEMSDFFEATVAQGADAKQSV